MGKLEVSDDTIVVKPRAKTLKGIRRLTDKITSSIYSGISGITKVVVTAGESEYYITTEGSNLEEVLKLKNVDPTRTTTNNIFEIYKVLGLEAAREKIVNEIEYVLNDQGLNVDRRHLELVGDAMTLDGSIAAIGRQGIAGNKASVFARAAFEETIRHLTEAAVRGEEDSFEGITENVIVGLPVKVGTGRVMLKYKG